MFAASKTAAVASAANYIEDVFSTYLYTGTGTTAGSTQTVTNNIDLSGKGGMVWIKDRAIKDHFLFDTNRGVWKYLRSNTTDAEPGVNEDALSAFNSNGFTLTGDNNVTQNGQNYVSWTFRKQAKFFDVVTWTGNNLSSQTIQHSLGSAPGCIIIKATNTTQNWWVYHRSTGTGNYLVLNASAAQVGGTIVSATSATDFTVGSTVTSSGINYVAYLFAHDAGGFGATGADNVISCGSFVASGAAQTINLGYEAQWVLVKRASGTGGWFLMDSMRGMAVTTDQYLAANVSNAEGTDNPAWISATATGFIAQSGVTSGTYIYVAIRRGPMKTPTTGTSVFGLNARSGTGANVTVTGGTGVDDAILIKNRGSAVADLLATRLTGTGYLETSITSAEAAAGTTQLQANPWDVMDGVKVGTTAVSTNASGNDFINYLFSRAPGFFDVVCYTGTGTTFSPSHNLQVVPDLVICKRRNGADSWFVYANGFGGNNARLNSSDPFGSVTNRITGATSTTFTVAGPTEVNQSGNTYVAYLFGSTAGLSKVGSYTGTGTTQTINCGFAAGARFVMIKRTDSTGGDWYVWDTARGIVSGSDPYWRLNNQAAEVTGTDYIDTDNSGFQISSTAPAAINANGGTFIFLAIA